MLRKSLTAKMPDLLTDQNTWLRRKLTKNKLADFIWLLFRLVLLVGMSFIILYPFIVKISSMFMSAADTYDDTVALIPRHPTFSNLIYLFQNTGILQALKNTAFLSLLVAALTTVSSTLVGYGLAKFRFPGVKLLLFFVLFTLLVPMSTILIPTFIHFRYFDIGGILRALSGKPVNLTNTYWPMFYLAATGFGFRGGLHTLIMWQCFRGLPHELDEAARVDGAGTARIFFNINLPLAKSMALVIFVLSFAWQWTDTMYSSTLYSDIPLFPYVLTAISGRMETALGNGPYFNSILRNTMILVAIIPLIVLYIFFQRKLVEGVERTGLVG